MTARSFIKDSGLLDVVHGRYGTLAVFANDIGAATQSLLTYGEWAENEISFLRHFVANGSTVVDVGAYIGTHTLAFANFVGATGRVIAIEAQPATFELLQQNSAMALPGVVQAEHALVSHQLGGKTIPTIDVGHEASFGSASLLDTLIGGSPASLGVGDATGQKAYLRAITIDSLELHNCALIKADVEGVEDLVLRGALQTLARCSPIVYCECNALATGLKVVDVLKSAGYIVVAHVVNAFNADNFFHVQENIFGDAKEIGLIGIPAAQLDSFVRLPHRSCELLLNINDADDLALALLNKPQYQPEILRLTAAARSGGGQFLDQYDALRFESRRLQDENVVLRRLRAEEHAECEKRIGLMFGANSTGVAEKESRITELSTFLDQRDAAITDLQKHADGRNQELAEFHNLLTQRDSSIEILQTQEVERIREIAELHALLTQRDAAIVRLQKQQKIS